MIHSGHNENNLGGKDMEEQISHSIKRGIEYIEGNFSQGFWRDFRSGFGESDEWVTGYVLNCVKNYKLNDSIKNQACDSLLSRLRDRGGWSYNSLVPADADSTAICTTALATEGRLSKINASAIIELLLLHQKQNGGFSTYYDPNKLRALWGHDELVSFEGWCSSHNSVTANAVFALLSLGVSKDHHATKRGIDFLVSNITPRGLWKNYWWTTNLYSSNRALSLLTTYQGYMPTINKAVNSIISLQTKTGGWKNSSHRILCPFSTALAFLSIVVSGNSAILLYKNQIKLALNWMLKHQNYDGSWSYKKAILRIPRTSSRPLTKKTTKEVRDQNHIFTTATVLSSLIESTRML